VYTKSSYASWTYGHHAASSAHGPNPVSEFVGWPCEMVSTVTPSQQSEGWNEEWHTSGQYPVALSTIWDSSIHVRVLMNTGPGYFIRKRQRATGDGRTTLVTLLNRSSRVRGRSLATSIGSLSNGNWGPARTEKPISNSNGHHVLTLGERDDVPLSNPSFFAEKKREGNALGLLTRSTRERRFLEAQIHTHTTFLF
jgi:hypothetical protein